MCSHVNSLNCSNKYKPNVLCSRRLGKKSFYYKKNAFKKKKSVEKYISIHLTKCFFPEIEFKEKAHSIKANSRVTF